MSRILLVAGALLIAAASAEARPVWKTYPTPLPPPIHLSKVRPWWIGPIWRSVAVPVSAVSDAGAVEPSPSPEPAAPTSWKQVFTTPLGEQPVITPVAAVPTPAPPGAVVVAKASEPTPAVAKPAASPPPEPIVVAEKTPDPPPAAKPAAAPAVMETAGPSTPWLDYIAAFAMAIVLGGVIFFFSRDRKRTA